MKKFLAGFLVCYIWAGASVGMGLKWGVPATNYYGVAYLTCIWPWWLASPWIGKEPPIPSWVFTFSPGKRHGT